LHGEIDLNAVTFLTPVTEEIKLVEERMRAQADHAHPDLRAALEHLLKAGGKRIRPTLGLLVGNMLGAPLEKLVTLGAAVELLHTATLVHDDLIDGSLLRRGMPTLNARWSPPATVLTGDFLFARAAITAAETDHLPLMKLFSETLAIIVNGELTQMFTSRGLINRDNYYKRIYAKTASLFEMTARASAMVSPVEETTIETMRDFGFQIGIAFQIVDDILDFNGEQSAVGKPLGSDLLNGLVTLPAIYYAEANPEDIDVLSLPNGGWTNNENMTRLVNNIRASNATKKAMLEADQHIDHALTCLESFEPCAERDALENLAKYIVDRKV
jgi:geranylgeranyl pyrophosphate synthase